MIITPVMIVRTVLNDHLFHSPDFPLFSLTTNLRPNNKVDYDSIESIDLILGWMVRNGSVNKCLRSSIVQVGRSVKLCENRKDVKEVESSRSQGVVEFCVYSISIWTI